MRKVVDLLDLSCLIAVAQCGTLTEAATLLHMSVSALSRRLAAIEEAMGVSLFDRKHKRMIPTPAGLTVLRTAEEILEKFDSISHLADEVSGRAMITVSGTLSGIKLHILPWLRAFEDEFPRYKIRFIDSKATESYTHLLSGTADIGVSYIAPDPEVFESWPVSTDRYSAIFPESLAPAGDSISWPDLQSFPLITVWSGNSGAVHSSVRKVMADHHLSWRHEVRHASLALELAKAGHGVAILPSASFSLTDAEGLKLLPLKGPEITRTISVFAQRSRHRRPAVERLLQLITGAGAA